MIIDFDSWVDLYEGTISEVAISDEKRVLIFVSQTETDSACALLTLQGVLESDGIPYSTHTVQSYRDIQRVFSSEVPQGEKAPTLRTLFMINCGATADLAHLLDLTADTRCIVIDSHRPIHHSYNNPEDMRCIVMLHPDEHLDTDAIPKPDQFADAFASTLDDDDDDDEENAGGGDGGENGEMGANTRGRERQGGASGTGRGAPQTGLRERLGEDDADDDVRASEEESPTEQGRHRQRQRLDGDGRYQGGPGPAAAGSREDPAGPSSRCEGASQKQERGTQLDSSRSQRRRWLQAWHEQKEEYYRRGRWYGAPAAYLAFALSHELRKDEPKYLWHAMVGTTDLRLQEHLTDTEYNSYSAVLQAHQQCLDDEQLEEGSAAAVAAGESQLQDGTIAVKATQLHVSCRSDSHMVLLRHWSLYDALCFSPYVASQLNTYTDSGRAAVDMLLAKVGVPLVQAKSAYSSMKPAHRELMEENLPEWAEEFNLKQLYFRGFALDGGNRTQLSASDVVHAATALVCLAPSDDAAAQQRAFLQATQAVCSGGNRNVFKKGVEGCKVLHKSVVQDGGSLLSPGSQHVRRLMEKRLNTIRALEVVNTALFSHPVPLHRLALFLQAGLQQRSGVPEDVLLVGPSNKDSRSLVVGLAHKGKRGGSLRKGNRFSAAFREAATQVQVHVSQDLFDAAYVQVHSDDLDNFLDMVGLLL